MELIIDMCFCIVMYGFLINAHYTRETPHEKQARQTALIAKHDKPPIGE